MRRAARRAGHASQSEARRSRGGLSIRLLSESRSQPALQGSTPKSTSVLLCTFEEMTAEEILEQIKARAQRATGVQGSFQFIIDGDKFIHIDARQTPPVVSMEEKPADCTVRLSSDTLSDLLTGKANPATAFMFGKIKVEGNMGLAMSLTKIL